MNPLQISQFEVPAGYIDLGLGHPQFSLLPLEALRRAAEGRLGDGECAFLQYGLPQGDGTFRRALADFLAGGYGRPVAPEELFVTNGTSMGLHLACSLFTRPGEAVLVEEPSYLFALRIFADHDLRVVPVRTDAAGLDLADLEAQLVHLRPKFLYLIPTYQNPTGRTLTEARRRRLVEISRDHDLLVLADEVYHLLGYQAQPPVPLAAFVHQAPIVSLGSFSKILAPGLRLGWLQAGPQLLQRFVDCGLLTSGGGMNPFTSAVVGRLIESGGLDANLARLREVYRRRADVLTSALREYLPALAFDPPQGGYFLWGRLPDGLQAAALAERAEALRIRFRPGTAFSSQGGLGQYLRLCFVFHSEEEIEAGVRRLADAFRQLPG